MIRASQAASSQSSNHFKHVMHRVWAYFEMCLVYTMAMFNVLAQWYGLQADENGVIHLSIAEFSLQSN